MNSLENLAIVLEKKRELNESLTLLFECLEIATKYELFSETNYLNNNLSRNYLAIKKLSLAKKHALDCLEKTHDVNVIRKVSNLLYNIYKEEKDYGNALKMYENNIIMKDSVMNNENQKGAIRQQIKYEF